MKFLELSIHLQIHFLLLLLKYQLLMGIGEASVYKDCSPARVKYFHYKMNIRRINNLQNHL